MQVEPLKFGPQIKAVGVESHLRKVMKILFLDFDGVLNSIQDSIYFRRMGGDFGLKLSPLACSNVQFLLDKEPKLRIVISSTWRVLHPFKELKQILTDNGIDGTKVIGVTPIKVYKLLEGQCRGSQIKSWLDHQSIKSDFYVDRYAIVDDDSDMLESQREFFVKTSILHGFMFSEALSVARILDIKTDIPLSYYF